MFEVRKGCVFIQYVQYIHALPLFGYACMQHMKIEPLTQSNDYWLVAKPLPGPANHSLATTDT